MADQAAIIAREAKGLHAGLKEFLKSRDPWEKEVDFQRCNLRRQYLRLLFQHPYTKESKDAETHLWMQTSYAIISIYKTRLNALDKASPPTRQQPQHLQPGSRQPGQVEFHRLLQRFRQFLAEEFKFWTQLLARFSRTFNLPEAVKALVELEILTGPDDNTLIPELCSPRSDGVNHTSTGRNRNQQIFPEFQAKSIRPQGRTERQGRLTIFSKALTCLGDIARYREQYNEAGRRPRAGHDEPVTAKNKVRNKKGEIVAIQFTRARDYRQARKCYEHAKALVPHEGNPSHQMAILAEYQKEPLEWLYHYYRALCVQQSYDTALENLATSLRKALDHWKTRTRQERNRGVAEEASTACLTHIDRITAFADNVVILHALWRLRVDKMDALSPNHAERIEKDFHGLLADRVLPIDQVSRVIVLAQGALWKHRMIRDTSNKKSESPESPATIIAVESRILSHVLGMHRSLLLVGIAQLAETSPEDAADHGGLAQMITAIFRRTIPALRIASKWLRANFPYLLQCSSPNTGINGQADHPVLPPKLVTDFWEKYVEFSDSLRRHFPVDRLPLLSGTLKEDVEMRGFLPLKGQMVGEQDELASGSSGAINAPTLQPVHGQVHPNEEELMRIADLLSDAQALAALEGAPAILRDNVPPETGSGPTNRLEASVVSSMNGTLATPERDDETATETTSHYDPVDAAMREALNHSDDLADEDDEIVWKPESPPSPIARPLPVSLPSPPTRLSPPSAFGPITPPANKTFNPITPRDSVQRSSLSSPTRTTAQDLVETLLRPLPTNSGSSGLSARPTPRHLSIAPQPQPLLGSGSHDSLTRSIWSTTPDDDLGASSAVSTSYQASTLYHAAPQQFSSPTKHELSPSIWSTDASQSIHIQQPIPAENRRLSPFLPQPIGHQRHSSAHTPHLTHFSTNQRQSPHTRHDSFTYSTASRPVAQQQFGGQQYSLAALYAADAAAISSTNASRMAYPSGFQHLGHRDPGVSVSHHTYAQTHAPVSQVWGSNG